MPIFLTGALETEMSNTAVRAISFTQRRCRSRSMEKLRRPRPPTPPAFCTTSCFCSAGNLRPSSLSRWLQKTASSICSRPLPASSANRASAVRPSLAVSDVRKAAEAWPYLAEAMVSQPASEASATSSAFFPSASIWLSSLLISCFASCHGPFNAFSTLPRCAARHALASAIADLSADAAACASFRRDTGVSSARSSASAVTERGAAFFSKAANAFWAFSTSSETALTITEAALRSLFSSCFRRSKASLLECSCLPSSTFLINESSFARCTLIFERVLITSALASANGPVLQSRNSWSLCVIKSINFLPLEAVALSSFSRFLIKAAYTVSGVKYVDPEVPCVVTQPSDPSFSTFTFIRTTPIESNVFASASTSTMSDT
mmetsp:Transcript_21624/g.42247  ORF Transcript_21624/g.42247 Transcript_21624/m.42247 type:complete len:378 (-) Transcript_21624:1461-2594(-)